MQRGAVPPSGVAGSAESGGFVRRELRRLFRHPQDQPHHRSERIVFRRRSLRSMTVRPIGRGQRLHRPASVDPDAGLRDAMLP
jgi:hypothetical protein